jgi:hypothetical protein
VQLYVDDGDLIWQVGSQHGAVRTYNVLKNTYDLKLVQGPKTLEVLDINCSATATCNAGDVTADLTVDLSGTWYKDITVQLKTEDGSLIWQVGAQHGAERHYNVLKNTYDLTFVQGPKTLGVDNIICEGEGVETCAAGDVTETLTVDLGGTWYKDITVQLYMDGGDLIWQVGAQHGAVRTYNVLRNTYDLKLVQGPKTLEVAGIDCSTTATCNAGDVTADLTVDLGGNWGSSITVELHKNDANPGTAGNLIWALGSQHGALRTYKVLKNTYDVVLILSGKTYIWDAVNCTGETCTLDKSTLTVDFPGISSAHVYVYPSNGVAGTVSGTLVASQTYKNDQAIFANLTNGKYDVKVVKNSKILIVDDVIVLGNNATAGDIVATLTVKFPGMSSVHTYIRVDDGASGTAAGGAVDERTYKNEETSLAVLKNTYDVVVIKNAKTKIIDAVDCTDDTCVVDNIVATLTVKFPGINSVHTYVRVDDGVAGTAAGGAVDERTYKNEETSLAVLKNTYDVVVVKNAKTKIIDEVNCTGDTCTVENIVATLTVKFPGISSVHTYVRVDDGVVGTAAGGAVDERTHKNEETSLAVLKNTYDVVVIKNAKTKIIDAVDCTGDTCTVENIVATLTVKFPGISSVHTYVRVDDGVVGTAAGGAVDERTYKNEETALAVLKNTYDVVVVKNAKTMIIDEVDCTGDTCLIEDIVATFTLNFPGKTSVHTYIKTADGTPNSATGGEVDNRTYQNNSTTMTLLKSYYDAIVKVGTETYILDDIDCTSNVCTYSLVVVKLLNSGGSGLADGSASYYKSVWKTIGTTPSNGILSFAMPGAPGTYSFRMSYAGFTQQKSNINIATTNPVVFQTLSTVVHFKDSLDAPWTGGSIEYYASGWKTFGSGLTDGFGNSSMELLPGAYSFRMSWKGYTQQQSNVNITTTNPVIFQTSPMVVHFKDSSNEPLSGGYIEYYASGWKIFGSGLTGGSGNASMELLPGTYSFRMSWSGYTQQKSNINITAVNPLEFQTQSVYARLEQKALPNDGIPGGAAQYYASGWKPLGTTNADGNTPSLELLPGSYSFKMTYAGATEQKSNIDITTINPVVFQTVNEVMSVMLQNSNGNPISGGVVNYYASGWKPFGTTNESGIAAGPELLPGKYSFRMTHGGYAQQKSNIDITKAENKPLVFTTIDMLVTLKDSHGNPIEGGEIKYYASGWKELGVTDENGEARFELLPGTYSFRMAYAGYTQQKSNINIETTNPLAFQMVEMVVKLKDSANQPLNGGVVKYYASGWKNFGITDSAGEARLQLLPGTYSFQMGWAGYTQQKSNIDISTTNPLEFQTLSMGVKLATCNDTSLEGGVIKYYASGWKSFGTTDADGSASLELLPGSYSFQMSWAGQTEQRSNVDIASVNPLVYNTTTVSLQFPGPIQYYAGGWKTYTSPMELLPYNYTFKFGSDQTKLDVSGCGMTKSVIILSLKDHAGKGLAGGTARGGYGSAYGTWFVPGSTDAKGLLFVFQDGLQTTMSYEMRFNNTTQVKTQDVSANSVFVFNTNLLTLRMETCSGTPLDGGNPRGGIGDTYTTWWFPGGATGSSNPGETAAEFFPATYSFEMQYEATADAMVSVTIPDADTLLTWQTTSVTLHYSGPIAYGGSGDSRFFDKPSMELLPGTYRFNFRNGGVYADLTWSGCTFEKTVAALKVVQSDGLTGQPDVSFVWQIHNSPPDQPVPGVTDANGVLLHFMDGYNNSPTRYVPTFEGVTGPRRDPRPATETFVNWQLINVTVKLVDVDGNLIPDATPLVTYEFPGGGRQTFGNLAGGQFSKEMMPTSSYVAFFIDDYNDTKQRMDASPMDTGPFVHTFQAAKLVDAGYNVDYWRIYGGTDNLDLATAGWMWVLPNTQFYFYHDTQPRLGPIAVGAGQTLTLNSDYTYSTAP